MLLLYHKQYILWNNCTVYIVFCDCLISVTSGNNDFFFTQKNKRLKYLRLIYIGLAFFYFFQKLKSRSKDKVKIKTAQHGNIEQSYKLLFCFLSNFTCHWVQNIKQTPIFLNTLTERLVNGLCWQVFWLGFVGLLDDRSSSLVKAKVRF